MKNKKKLIKNLVLSAIVIGILAFSWIQSLKMYYNYRVEQELELREATDIAFVPEEVEDELWRLIDFPESQRIPEQLLKEFFALPLEERESSYVYKEISCFIQEKIQGYSPDIKNFTWENNASKPYLDQNELSFTFRNSHFLYKSDGTLGKSVVCVHSHLKGDYLIQTDLKKTALYKNLEFEQLAYTIDEIDVSLYSQYLNSINNGDIPEDVPITAKRIKAFDYYNQINTKGDMTNVK